MIRLRAVALTKGAWNFSAARNESAWGCGLTKYRGLVAPEFALPLSQRFIQQHSARRDAETISAIQIQEPGIMERILGKIGIFDIDKYKRQLQGYLLYEDIANNVGYQKFFDDFKMADTFYSWFVIMELHVWMLMIRYVAEGKPGLEIRSSMVEAMWADVNKRKNKLKNANVVALRNQVEELSYQFNAAIIGYDEGILSDDKVLAAAIWRRFFQCEGKNPEHLETLVYYVRKQVSEFDRMSSKEIMSKESMQWVDYRNVM